MKLTEKKDIRILIASLESKYGKDNVKINTDDGSYHITTPKSQMRVQVMDAMVEEYGISFAGWHTTSKYLFDVNKATSGDRDAATLAFWYNQEAKIA